MEASAYLLEVEVAEEEEEVMVDQNVRIIRQPIAADLGGGVVRLNIITLGVQRPAGALSHKRKNTLMIFSTRISISEIKVFWFII